MLYNSLLGIIIRSKIKKTNTVFTLLLYIAFNHCFSSFASSWAGYIL